MPFLSLSVPVARNGLLEKYGCSHLVEIEIRCSVKASEFLHLSPLKGLLLVHTGHTESSERIYFLLMGATGKAGSWLGSLEEVHGGCGGCQLSWLSIYMQKIAV
jgi:hypothetical protein